MSIIFRYFLRTLRKNLIPFILILLSLTLSSAVFYLNLNIKNDLLAVSEKIVSGKFGGYEVCISDKENGISSNDLNGKGLKTLPIQYLGETTLPILENEITISAVASNWVLASNSKLVKLAEGVLPYSKNTIGLTYQKAQRLGIELGDSITVPSGEYSGTYTVCGLFSTIGFFENRRDDFIEILVGLDESKQYNAFLVDVPSSKNTNSLASKWEKAHPTWKVELLYENTNVTNNGKSIKQILYLIVALCVIMGGYVIFSVSSIISEKRISDFAIFRSVGASKLKTNGFVFLEHSLYGLFGGIFGLGLGEFARFLLKRVFYNVSNTKYIFRFDYALLTILFSLLFETLITLFFIYKSNKKSVKEVIIKNTSTINDLSKKSVIIGFSSLILALIIRLVNVRYYFTLNVIALFLIIFGFSFLIPLAVKFLAELISKLALKQKLGTLFLASKNVKTERIYRSSVTLTATLTYLLLVIFTLTLSVNTFYKEYLNNYPYDVYVYGGQENYETYGFISSVSGVDKTYMEFWDNRSVLINGKKVHACLAMRGGYPNGIEVSENLINSLSEGHVIIDELLAKRLNLKVNDKIHIADYYKEGVINQSMKIEEGYDLIIDGFCNSSVFDADRTTLILYPTDYYENVEDCPAVIGVMLNGEVNENELATNIANEVYNHTKEDIKVYSKNEYLKDELNGIKNVLAIFSLIPAFAVTVAIFGLINNQTVIYHRKKREYAILYSVAMSHKHLGRMAFFEMFLTFIFGELFGLCISVWVTKVLRDVLFSLIAYVSISYDIIKISILLAITLLLLFLSSFIPKRIIEKSDIVEVIKYE